MSDSSEQSKIVELFGSNITSSADWQSLVSDQQCPFTQRRCFKIRKSDSRVSIGTCSVRAGRALTPLIICPNRLLEGGQVFTDCLHLLTKHQPGNQLHLVPEVTIPGGSVDYFLVSALGGEPKDFVGIEFQTLDTTGTAWPARQSFLRSVGMKADILAGDEDKSFGINWKMTAKTILVQIHHKIETFEAMGRSLVLVVQTPFMSYMESEFNFGHLAEDALPTDSMHFHSYDTIESQGKLTLALSARRSTSANGISQALNLGAEAVIEEASIFQTVKSKMSQETRWSPIPNSAPF